jgi:solute carrier family 8 (sodium/calcium exchanger)
MGILFPGLSLLPTPVLAIFYGLALVYLFMGINVVSDIFMDSIGIITSQSYNITERDDEGNVTGTKKVLVWNSTMANLTLMALGSSAPEIILAIFETSATLTECPGELGPSTIVGSAAFNLLIICGVSVYAVSEESEKKKDEEERDPTLDVGLKKINDLGVFGVTATSSLFAYAWMWFCLRDMIIEIWEAVLTFLFFFLLLGIAYFMDRRNSANQVEADDEGLSYAYTAVEVYKGLLAAKSTPEKNLSKEEK